jgi:HEAT repeat protein
VLPSKSLAGDIEARAERLPWTHGRERVDLITWFAMVGEPTYDTLLGYLEDERPEVVATVLAALGATGDSRLVPYLRLAEKPEWPAALKLESARARVRLGDWQAMPALIDGLESGDHFKRALCAQALFEATRENKGFDPGASLPEREAAVDRWRTWWQRRSSDSLLVSRAD